MLNSAYTLGVDPHRRQQIEGLFRAALAEPDAARAEFVKEQAGADLELAREVHARLADAQTDSTLTMAVAGLAPGALFSHYRIEEKLGEGGMGVVYRAFDTRLRRSVALKFLVAKRADDPEMQGRFIREARAASALNHPNICTIYHVGSIDNRQFIAMEFLEGEPLARKIRHSGAGRGLDWAALLKWAMEITDALGAAHHAGIIHRDLKPANIFITVRDQAKILDFGLAKHVAEEAHETTGSLTETGVVMGTIAYMSPEQAQGQKLDARSDVFSLGVMLFEMAAGQRPFRGDSQATVLGAILHSAAPDLRSLTPGLPVELCRIVAKCLEKDRERRYSSAGEVHDALQRLAAPVALARRPGLRWKWPAALAAGLAVIAAGGYYFQLQPKSAPRPVTKLVVASLSNGTGEASLDGAVATGIAVQFAGSTSLQIVTPDVVGRHLRFMRQKPDVSLTPELARQVCYRASASAVVEPKVTMLGNRLVVNLKARRCDTGEVIGEQQEQVDSKDQVLASVEKLVPAIRGSLEAVELPHFERNPMADVTTASEEALREYEIGEQQGSTRGEPGSEIAHLTRATELDPEFAAAFSHMAIAYWNTGDSTSAKHAASRAYELRDRVSDSERYQILYIYERNGTGDLEKGWQALQAWLQAYPNDTFANGVASGLVTRGTGRYDVALFYAQKMMKSGGTLGAIRYINLVWDYMYLERPEEAEKALQQAQAQGMDSVDLRAARFVNALLRGDGAQQKQLVEESRGKGGVEDMMLHLEALSAARAGRLRDAADRSARAIDLAKRAGGAERAQLFVGAAAIYDALLGDRQEAVRQAGEVLKLSDGRDGTFTAAVALGLSGKDADASRMAESLNQRFPSDTAVQTYYLPTVRSLLALNRKNPAQAVEELKATLSNEWGASTLTLNTYYGALYSAYFRGQAFLDLHKPKEAVVEYQKVLAHPRLVGADPIGALVYLQLGRAFAQAGDRMQAEKAYAEFLRLWKDAEPQSALLMQAKAEYELLAKP